MLMDARIMPLPLIDATLYKILLLSGTLVRHCHSQTEGLVIQMFIIKVKLTDKLATKSKKTIIHDIYQR